MSILITFDGVNGSGKTTVIKRLKNRMIASSDFNGYSIHTYRCPGDGIPKIRRMFKDPKESFDGMTDLFLACADVSELTLADWDETMNLNLRAPFLLAQQAQIRMRAAGGGLIVNITDVAASKVWAEFPVYSVSKSALQSLTKILARSFAPDVRVNAIAPGLALPAENMPEAEWNRLVNRLPLQRSAREEELASALEFLLKNEYITGQTITVDGGYSLI